MARLRHRQIRIGVSKKLFPAKPQRRPRWLTDVPRRCQNGLSMAQDGLRCLSQAVFSLHIGPSRRSLASPSFCIRCTFALFSLCFRFAFRLPLLCHCFALVLTCFFFAFASLCFRHGGGIPEAIRTLWAL
jgi:hypothetical protein